MIGHLNANLITCQSYIYLYYLYGRTVLDHVRGRLRLLHKRLGVVDDTLGDVGRVYNRPLGGCPAGSEEQAQGNQGDKKLDLFHS